MKLPQKLNTSQIYRGIVFLALVSILPQLSVFAADEQPRRLNIITSFPPEFYQPFILRYQALHPAVQLQILNKKTTAALEEIEKGNSRKFDLFWSSSLDAFEVLKRAGMLQHSGYKQRYSALSIQDIPLHNPGGYYYSFALSSVGFMWSRHFLEDNHLPVPMSWEALADPIYYGHLAMSTPSRSGTTHLIVESILQSMGWQQGWAYLLQTAGNLATVTARSFSVPEGIVNGRFGIGFVIDFLAQGQMSTNGDIDFRYGEPTLLMPAAIGLPQNCENKEEAIAFIDFLLSPDGQRILLDPAISRLPVITGMYSSGGTPPPELFQRIQQGKTHPYNTELSRIRYQLVNHLFDQLITYRLLERRRIWKRLIGLDTLKHVDPGSLETVKKKVISLISEVPVSEKQSIDPDFATLFATTAGVTHTSEQKRQQLQAWDDFVDQKLGHAQISLDDFRQNFSNEQE